MNDPLLFHLHFNTPAVDAAADRLDRLGLPLRRRFGSVRGEGLSLAPGDPTSEDFRFKLQVHQAGAVNLTLAPGRRPRFDHLGFVVEDFEAALDRAEHRGWAVRRDERRTFVMTPWGFRIELHPPDGEGSVELGPASEARLEEVKLQLDDPASATDALAHVVGGRGALRLEAGDGPRVASFALRSPTETRRVTVEDLLAQAPPE